LYTDVRYTSISYMLMKPSWSRSRKPKKALTFEELSPPQRVDRPPTTSSM
jgi:hypothetical protein